MWGRGVFGEYPFPQKLMTVSNAVVDVSLGRNVNVAVDEKGLAWSWGENKEGELGVGDCEPRVHPFPVLSLKGKSVAAVFCGDSFVVALGSKVKKEVPGLSLPEV